ncbi:MAG TPA: DUF6703 family protein [Mycobacteriales bacterium]|nr:DUF6703 family protein [Mycobacteriales bacterium]
MPKQSPKQSPKRPLPQAKPAPFLTPNASPVRREVERRSAIVVLFLRGLPRALPALVVLAVVAGGLALPGPAGAVCLVLSALILAWLVYLSWPALSPGGRLIRLLVIGAVLTIATGRFF